MATGTLNWNGNNFYNIVAGDGAVINKVTFETSDTFFVDAKQFRLGGFAPNNVPDGGATLVSLAVALLGLGSMRRVLAVKA